jgi:hypothetical protein
MKLLTTTCPGCRKEAIDTVGFIGKHALQTQANAA